MSKSDIFSDGFPKAQERSQINKSLQAVALATRDARHPGPRPNPNDPLEKIVAETVDMEARATNSFSNTTVTPRVNESATPPSQNKVTETVTQPFDLPILEAYVPEAKECYQMTCNMCNWVGMMSHDPHAIPRLSAQWEILCRYYYQF